MSAQKPSLIRPKDYFIILLPIFLALTAISAAILSHLNYTTWGEKVEVGGWVTVSIMAAACFWIVFAYLYERWKWVSKWKFTTNHGIQCFFDDGAAIYLKYDVEDATEEMYTRWGIHYHNFGQEPVKKTTLQGTTCLFVAPSVFTQSTPGFKERLVYGLSGWNWMKIGQGGKPIEQTAFIHEASHIHLNKMRGVQVPEDEAHELFKTVRV